MSGDETPDINYLKGVKNRKILLTNNRVMIMMIEINTDTVFSVDTPKINKVDAVQVANPFPERGKNLPVTDEESAENTAQSSSSEKDFNNVVRELNNHVQRIQRELEFSVDETSGRTVIKVVDLETKEVIRQIPGEEALRVAQKLNEGSTLEIFNSYF